MGKISIENMSVESRHGRWWLTTKVTFQKTSWSPKVLIAAWILHALKHWTYFENGSDTPFIRSWNVYWNPIFRWSLSTYWNTATNLGLVIIPHTAVSVVLQKETSHFEHSVHENFLKWKQIISAYYSHLRFVILYKFNVMELIVGSKELRIRRMLKVLYEVVRFVLKMAFHSCGEDSLAREWNFIGDRTS